MHTLELTITERIQLLGLLPRQGGLIKMRLVHELGRMIEFTPTEIEFFALRDEENGRIVWDKEKAQPIHIEIESRQLEILRECIAVADARETISLDMLPLVDKIEVPN